MEHKLDRKFKNENLSYSYSKKSKEYDTVSVSLNPETGAIDVEQGTSDSGSSVIIYQGEVDDEGCQRYLNITTSASGSVHVGRYTNCTDEDGVSAVLTEVTQPWFDLEA